MLDVQVVRDKLSKSIERRRLHLPGRALDRISSLGERGVSDKVTLVIIQLEFCQHGLQPPEFDQQRQKTL
jgi:hypothetical protein